MGAAPIYIFEDRLQNKALSAEYWASTFTLVDALDPRTMVILTPPWAWIQCRGWV